MAGRVAAVIVNGRRIRVTVCISNASEIDCCELHLPSISIRVSAMSGGAPENVIWLQFYMALAAN